MLFVRPQTLLGWSFAILDADEQPAGGIRMSAWREKAGLVVDNTSYEARREQLFSGRFLLERNGETVAYAEKPSAMRRQFEVFFGKLRLELESESAFRRAFVVRMGDTVVGSIRPETALRRRAVIDLPDELPRPLQVFLCWLVLLLWKRSSDSASGGG